MSVWGPLRLRASDRNEMSPLNLRALFRSRSVDRTRSFWLFIALLNPDPYKPQLAYASPLHASPTLSITSLSFSLFLDSFSAGNFISLLPSYSFCLFFFFLSSTHFFKIQFEVFSESNSFVRNKEKLFVVKTEGIVCCLKHKLQSLKPGSVEEEDERDAIRAASAFNEWKPTFVPRFNLFIHKTNPILFIGINLYAKHKLKWKSDR